MNNRNDKVKELLGEIKKKNEEINRQNKLIKYMQQEIEGYKNQEIIKKINEMFDKGEETLNKIKELEKKDDYTVEELEYIYTMEVRSEIWSIFEKDDLYWNNRELYDEIAKQRGHNGYDLAEEATQSVLRIIEKRENPMQDILQFPIKYYVDDYFDEVQKISKKSTKENRDFNETELWTMYGFYSEYMYDDYPEVSEIIIRKTLEKRDIYKDLAELSITQEKDKNGNEIKIFKLEDYVMEGIAAINAAKSKNKDFWGEAEYYDLTSMVEQGYMKDIIIFEGGDLDCDTLTDSTGLFPKLKFIGGNAYFSNLKIADFPELQFINGDGYFPNVEKSNFPNMLKKMKKNSSGYFAEFSVDNYEELQDEIAHENLIENGTYEEIGEFLASVGFPIETPEEAKEERRLRKLKEARESYEQQQQQNMYDPVKAFQKMQEFNEKQRVKSISNMEDLPKTEVLDSDESPIRK